MSAQEGKESEQLYLKKQRNMKCLSDLFCLHYQRHLDVEKSSGPKRSDGQKEMLCSQGCSVCVREERNQGVRLRREEFGGRS